MIKRYLLLMLFVLVFTVEASTTIKSEQQTLSIVKPDAVKGHHIGEIVSRFEKAGLKIVAMKMVMLTKPQAMEFYAEHKEKPFFGNLVALMTSGPSVTMVLQGPDAIGKNRELMGATDPKKALPGTIRSDFAESVNSNAVHGSDAPESAQREIRFFFKPDEIHLR